MDLMAIAQVAGGYGIEALRSEVEHALLKYTSGKIGIALDTWRQRNALIMIFGADARLKEAGVEAEAVRPTIFEPLLNAASLEEDENLRDKWINLLANAADPRHNLAAQPTFIAILRDLTPQQARFLDGLYRDQMCGAAAYASLDEFDLASLRRAYWEGNGIELDAKHPVPQVREAETAVDVLIRQNILAVKSGTVSEPGPSGPSQAAVSSSIRLTQLGMAFIRAVRPPSSR